MWASKLYDKVYGSLIGGLIGDAMGAPSEGMDWPEIEKKFGEIKDFEGSGTDDSAIKQILCEAIIENGGHATADEFAASFLRNKRYYPLFYIPVRNMFHKIESGLVYPVDAGHGNMHSSSTAMVISPIGIINACNPRQAAAEAFDIAGLIHAGPSGFCRDAACAVAAMVAEAMKSSSTIDSILGAATSYLHPISSGILRKEIDRVMESVKKLNDYAGFREWFYTNCLRDIISDSRETVPCVMALLYLAKGDPERVIIYGANFGRDSDTIGTMAGAIAGAFKGASGIKREWVNKVETAGNTVQATSKDYGMTPVVLADQCVLAEKLVDVINIRQNEFQEILDQLKDMT
jgi:ADP-ribosylglycohydrolase